MSGLERIDDMNDVLIDVMQRAQEGIERRFRLERDGYVYLLGGEGYYKIGRAKNVSRRLRQLEIQLPWPVRVEHTIPCAGYVEAEKELHAVFAEKRANGEWFALSAEDVAWIKGIRRMRGRRMDRGEGR